RWRTLGHHADSLSVAAAAARSRPSLEPRSHHHFNHKRQRNSHPVHHLHNHNHNHLSSSSSSHPPPALTHQSLNPSSIKSCSITIKRPSLFVHALFDKLSVAQKKDVHAIWAGHLNHDNLNRRLIPSTIFASSVPPINDLKSSDDAGKGGGGGGDPPQLSSADPLSDIAHVDVPDNFEAILEQFDAISGPGSKPPPPAVDGPSTLDAKLIATSEPSCEAAVAASKEAPQEKTGKTPTRHFLPSSSLHTTKSEKYMVVKAVDSGLVESKWNYKKSRHSEADKAAELAEFLRKELIALNCPSQGPDIRRLQVFSSCFDRIIGEFKSYSSILAEIKAEYDLIIRNFDFDQTELEFLRAKVRKLIAQNQNRLLLRYERRKSNELEKKVESLKDENENLKSELRRKLALYASYLPPSTLHEKRKNDALLAEIEPQAFLENEDPITQYERKIQQLSEETQQKTSEIDRLTRSQQEDYVPKTLSNKLADSLKETETNYDKLKSKSAELESVLSEKQALVTKLENALREKEEQYHFLISEYTGLTEAVKGREKTA
ncbi:hypothetical protein HDU67_003612, partial [Dinochytrium kinnereticum]